MASVRIPLSTAGSCLLSRILWLMRVWLSACADRCAVQHEGRWGERGFAAHKDGVPGADAGRQHQRQPRPRPGRHQPPLRPRPGRPPQIRPGALPHCKRMLLCNVIYYSEAVCRRFDRVPYLVTMKCLCATHLSCSWARDALYGWMRHQPWQSSAQCAIMACMRLLHSGSEHLVLVRTILMCKISKLFVRQSAILFHGVDQ